MSNIRKEYSEYKHFKEQIFIEAAETWTEENVILINERLNRNAIYRLNSSIQRFDNKFGPYRDKLPAIAKILNDAENGLHLVITGKIGSRSAAHMLQRMSIMYNILSNFFSNDIKALLRTPAFRIALAQGDTKINEISDEKHDIKAIKRSMAAALKPNDQERTLFRRAYKSFDMPNLDWNEAAKQLCCLSCNELQELAGIETVPMVVNDTEESGMSEAGAARTAAAVGGTVLGSAVAGAVTAGIAAGKGLTGRFSGPTPQDIAEMNKYLKKIENVIPNVPETANLIKGLKALEANIKKAESGAKFAGWNPLRNPTQRAISQGKQLIDIFEKLGQTWNAAKGKYKEPLTDEDINNIQKLLTTQVNSVGQKLGRLFKTNLPPGLTAKDIINGLVALAKKSSEETPQTQEPVKENALTKLFAEMPNKTMLSESLKYQFNLLHEFETYVEKIALTEGFEDLDNILSNFASIKTNIDDKLEKQEINAPSETTADVQPVRSSPTKKAVDDPSKAAETEAAKENDIASEDIDTAIGAVTRATEQEIGKDRLDALNKAIADLQIPNVNDAASASKFLTTYKSLLTKDIEIGNLINILASNVQQSGNIQEQRSIAINIIKRILLEAQPLTTSPAAGGAAGGASKWATARFANLGNVQKNAVQPGMSREAEFAGNVGKMSFTNPPTSAVPPATPPATPAATPPAVPTEPTEDLLKKAATDAATVEKSPQVVSVVDSQIKALEIPGINDVASVVKFVNDYISIVGKMKEIKELLAMLKNVSDVKKYPKVAEQTQATTTTSSAPASTQTSVGTAGTTT